MSVESQVCELCHKDKPIADFWPCHKKLSDTGYLKTCKECKLTPKKPIFIPLNKLEETGLL